jgi:putative ABC transport system permease protein
LIRQAKRRLKRPVMSVQWSPNKATRGRVIGLVIKEGVILASAGLALGLAGAYFVERAMQGTLFGISRFDLSAFAAVGLILLTTALPACYRPAHRAASTEPMAVLRSE